MGNLEDKCPLCGHEGASKAVRVHDWRFGIGEDRSLVQCDACSCHFLSPFPERPEDEYPEAYTPWSRSSASGMVRQAVKGVRNRLTGQRDFDFTGRTLSGLKTLAGQGGKTILDVGAGSGLFLDWSAGQGFSTTGLDFSETALDRLRERGHRAMGWEELAQGTERFDVITLHHVLEHLVDPIAALKTLRTKIRSGGKLVVVVPRIDCACFRSYGEFYSQLDGGRHVIMYSPETLGETVRRAGFAPQSVKTFSKAGNLYYSWLRAKNGGKKENRLAAAIHTMRFRPRALLVSLAGRGEIMEMVAGPEPADRG